MAVALVAQRILEPGSNLAAARCFWPKTAVSTLASELGLPENAGEDWFLEHQPRIEKALAERHPGEGRPILYDLTTVWSYSRTCPLANYGYSRDGRRGLPQIEFGLLCDGEGRPVAVVALPGTRPTPPPWPPKARRKATSKRTRSGKAVHDFRRLLRLLGTLTTNRIEPAGPGKPGFDALSSPTPIQQRTLRRLNAKIPTR